MNQLQFQDVCLNETLFSNNFRWNLTEQALLQSIKDNAREVSSKITSLQLDSPKITTYEETTVIQEAKLKLLAAFVERCLSPLQDSDYSPRARSCYLLSNLFDMVSTLWLAHRSNNDIVCLIWHIFVDTIQPFLKIIKEFLLFGNLRDPFQEFFVWKTDPGDQFCLSHLGDVPNFLQEIYQIVLLCGTSQKIICSLKTPGFTPNNDIFLDLSYFSSQYDQSNFIAQLSATVTFEVIVAEHLLQPIQMFSLDIESKLVQQLLHDQKLLLFLECLRDFYFMKSGNFMDWDFFISNYFYQLDQRNPECTDEAFIESLLQDSVKTQLVPFKVSCRETRENLDIKLLERMKFSFEIRGILAHIVSEEDISDYNSILIFLFQIARTKHLLDHLHFYSHVCHKLLLLRAKLSHFVNNLQNYVIHRVAKTAWKTLKQSINKQSSVNALRNLHKSFLLNVKENCLLTEKTTTLLHAIIGILNISTKLSFHFTKPTMIDAEIVELDSQFQGSMTLLLAIISKILAQKKISSLEDLALRLDFNGFYATNRFQK